MPKKQEKPNKPYDLPTLRVPTRNLLLSLDPGSKNQGIALVGVENNRVRVYANAIMMKPVNDLVNFAKSSRAFLNEFSWWMDMYEPIGIVAERFQARGMMGNTGEMVSTMLGLIRGTYPTVALKLTVAATWKNRVQRRFKVDLKEIYPTLHVKPHQLDAALIGIYGLEVGYQRVFDYELTDIIRQVEESCLMRRYYEHENAERMDSGGRS